MTDIQYPDTPFRLHPSLILLGRRGSEAHGTYIPSTDPNGIDDRDLMGVVIPPARYYLGLSKWEHAESINGCWDVVLYEFRKFVGLLMKQNPNVIGMLWLEPEDYLITTPSGRLLIENRNLFRDKNSAYASFCGYAESQIKKMHASEFRGYMGARRKALVEKHGYDTKNAAHLIRLLHMGKEFIETGEMKVRRTWDRDMLLDVKRGGWSLERVQTYADSLFSGIREAKNNSQIPETMNYEAIEELVMRIMRTELAHEFE